MENFNNLTKFISVIIPLIGYYLAIKLENKYLHFLSSLGLLSWLLIFVCFDLGIGMFLAIILLLIIDGC